jgi:hypothetical protein
MKTKFPSTHIAATCIKIAGNGHTDLRKKKKNSVEKSGQILVSSVIFKKLPNVYIQPHHTKAKIRPSGHPDCKIH